MPELLEESSEMLELLGTELEHLDLVRDRLKEKLWGKKVDEPVNTLFFYVANYCAYHRGLSTSVQSAEMIETAERFDQIPTNVFKGFNLAFWRVSPY